MTAARTSLGSSLKLGFAAGVRHGGVLFAVLFGPRAVQTLLEATLGPAVLGLLDGKLPPAAAGAFLTLWLLAELAASVALVIAATVLASRLRGEPVRAALDGRLARAAIALFLVGGAVTLATRLWRWTVGLAGGGLYLRSLTEARLGGSSAAALALALVLAIPVALFASTWIRLALARSASRREGYLVALYETAGTFAARPLAPIAVVLIVGFVATALEVMASGIPPLSPRFTAPHAQDFAWARSLVSAALVAMVRTLAELWALGALVALEVELPPEPLAEPIAIPPSEPILDAMPIVDAQPIDAEPVVDALPTDPERGPDSQP